MNIILGTENVQALLDKYVVLELDTLQFSSTTPPVTAYCVIENVPFDQIIKIDEYKDLHDNLIKNFKLQYWDYCEQAIEHLMGKWNGEVDSFYTSFLDRIKKLKTEDLGNNWNGVIINY